MICTSKLREELGLAWHMWPGMVGFCPWQLHHNSKEGRTGDSLNRRGESRQNRDDRHHFTRVIKVKANQWVFTSQHHNFHFKTHVPSTRCRFPAGLRPWESVTHPHSKADCHLLAMRGNLAPRPGLQLQVPSQALGVLGPGRLLSQRAPG